MNAGAFYRAIPREAFPHTPPVAARRVCSFAGCGGGGGRSPRPTTSRSSARQHITLRRSSPRALAEQKASLKAQGQTASGRRVDAVRGAARRRSSTCSSSRPSSGSRRRSSGSPSRRPRSTKQLAKSSRSSTSAAARRSTRPASRSRASPTPQVRGHLQEKLLEQKLYKQITKGATVTAAEIAAYYAANQSQYQTAASRPSRRSSSARTRRRSRSRSTRSSRPAATSPRSRRSTRRIPARRTRAASSPPIKGSDVPEFDAAVFAPTAKTGVVLKPVNTAQYGWFVIKPLAAVTPAKTTPEKKAAAVDPQDARSPASSSRSRPTG